MKEEPYLWIQRCEGSLNMVDDVLRGDKALQYIIRVNKRQLFDSIEGSVSELLKGRRGQARDTCLLKWYFWPLRAKHSALRLSRRIEWSSAGMHYKIMWLIFNNWKQDWTNLKQTLSIVIFKSVQKRISLVVTMPSRWFSLLVIRIELTPFSSINWCSCPRLIFGSGR